MATLVTLDIFSGRPNPTWELNDEQANQFKEKIYGLTEKTLMKTPRIYYGLGYRGFLIETIGDKDLPSQMIANANLIDFGWTRESYIDKSHVIELWLLETAGIVIDDETKAVAAKEIKAERNAFAFFYRDKNLSQELLSEPPYNPGWWNNDTTRRQQNNCYNYACNVVTNSFGQPGRGSGRMYAEITCREVGAGANRDGLASISNIASSPAEGQYVALVVGPRWDFHWYRRDSNGLWSHKPGRENVINYDQSGSLIRDPRNASRGLYTDFCGFFHAVPGRIRIL